MQKIILWLFYLCWASLAIGLLWRLPVGGAGILLLDILLPLTVAVWLAWRLLMGKIEPARWLLPGFLFAGIALASWFYGSWELLWHEKLISLSHLFRWLTFLLAGLMITDLATHYSLFHRQCWAMLLGILTIILVAGLVQFIFVPDISQWATQGGFDPHIGRFLSTWMDPNLLAGLLAFCLPLLCARLYFTRTRFYYWCWGVLFLGLIGLLLTFSRSGYLAAMIGLGFFFLVRDFRILLVGFLLVSIGAMSHERSRDRLSDFAMTAVTIIQQDTGAIDPTAAFRLQSWQGSLELWQKNPWLGVGYNTYRYRASEEGLVKQNFFSAGAADSSLLTILATTGVIGLASFLYFWLHLWNLSWRRYWQNKNKKAVLYLGFCAGLLGLMVHSVFVNSWLFPLILLPVMTMGALLMTPRYFSGEH